MVSILYCVTFIIHVFSYFIDLFMTHPRLECRTRYKQEQFLFIHTGTYPDYSCKRDFRTSEFSFFFLTWFNKQLTVLHHAESYVSYFHPQSLLNTEVQCLWVYVVGEVQQFYKVPFSEVSRNIMVDIMVRVALLN